MTYKFSMAAKELRKLALVTRKKKLEGMKKSFTAIRSIDLFFPKHAIFSF